VASDEYIYRLKDRAVELGVAISGTGIRNDFASPDPEVRAEGVKMAKEWIVVASKLGAPVIRLFAGKIHPDYKDKWEEQAMWMVDCYIECAKKFAEQYGVKIVSYFPDRCNLYFTIFRINLITYATLQSAGHLLRCLFHNKGLFLS
jgi:sugar phosphate isomerase/epimerase